MRLLDWRPLRTGLLLRRFGVVSDPAAFGDEGARVFHAYTVRPTGQRQEFLALRGSELAFVVFRHQRIEARVGLSVQALELRLRLFKGDEFIQRDAEDLADAGPFIWNVYPIAMKPSPRAKPTSRRKNSRRR